MGDTHGPGKIGNLDYADKLEGIGMQDRKRAGDLYRTTNPLFKEQAAQSLEALKTGGVGAQIPIIQRAVEQSKIGTSQAMSGAQDRLRGAGLADTPFGQSNLSNIATTGALNTSRIPTEIAQQFINNAGNVSGQGFGASQNFANMGANTMGNLQQMDLQRQMANAAQFQAFMDQMGKTMTSLTQSSMGACLHPDTPIETPVGDRAIRYLHIGDRVMTADAQGNRIEGRVRMLNTVPVELSHTMAIVPCDRGDAIITPAHPLPNGDAVVPVPAIANLVTGMTDYTMDLAVDGPTGIYFVLGTALGSTLDARHRRVA